MSANTKGPEQRSLRLLRIYLNDHLAGVVAGLELAHRCRMENPAGLLGDFLDKLGEGLQRDRALLEDSLRRLGSSPDSVKQGAAWLAEKVGRLKLNGQLRGYSPLSRVEELEGLERVVEHSLSTWQNLSSVRSLVPQLEALELDPAIRRAMELRETLQGFRRQAAREAFAPGPDHDEA